MSIHLVALVHALSLAIEAGRAAFDAGLKAPQDMAVASTPCPGALS